MPSPACCANIFSVPPAASSARGTCSTGGIRPWAAACARISPTTSSGSPTRRAHHKSDALLKGLLFCRLCHHAMTPAHSIAHRKKYRYYICTTRAETARSVVRRSHSLRKLSKTPCSNNFARWRAILLYGTIISSKLNQGPARLAELAAEKAALDKELTAWK